MMKVGSLQAFPSPIMYMTLGEQCRELNKMLLEDLFIESKEHLNTNRSGIGIGQTNANLQKKYKSFSGLKNIVDDIVDSVVKDFFGISGKAESQAFWGNIDENPHGYHIPHAHNARELMHGVYFPTSGWTEDENLSDKQNLDDDIELRSSSQPDPGDLVFLDPIHFVKTPVVIKENVQRFPFFGNPICFTPREGTMVFFPCWLPHMVTPTAKPGFTRVSIAFGVDFL